MNKISYLAALTIYSLFFLFAISVKLVAQGDITHLPVTDTVIKKNLGPVTISAQQKYGTGHNQLYSSGTGVRVFDSSQISGIESSSLSTLLKRESALYLKEYGPGMGSYISVRGTSSSHTTVSWNDLNLSFPTMGISDLSRIPLYFIDKAQLHIGGGSTHYGDGSIGGAISLQTFPKWENGVHGNLLTSAGSYGSTFLGATLRAASSSCKVEYRGSVFKEASQNDFYFKNNTIQSTPFEKQQNSAINNSGILQELNKKFVSNRLLTILLLYTVHDREIQPSVSNNRNESSYREILDNNLKLLLRFSGGERFLRGVVNYDLSLNYSYDSELFEDDLIEAKRVGASIRGEYRERTRSYKLGVENDLIKPTVESYFSDKEEVRNTLYFLLKETITKDLTVTAGVRKLWVTDVKTPLMPALDFKYRLLDTFKISNTILNLDIRGSISQSARVPTLNDRYWGSNNSYLMPEISRSIETGTDLNIELKKEFSAQLSFTFYRLDVNNWIRWLPAGSVWRPQNIPNVNSSGFEILGKVERLIGRQNKIIADFSYNYTSVTMKEALWVLDPSVNRQLAYQPKHTSNLRLKLESKKREFFVSTSYTGSRTTVDIYDYLPPYLLVNCGATYNISLFKKRAKLSINIRNLLNIQYQNVKFYAMPGINYNSSLRIDF